MYRPLADLIRPESLDDVAGQSHILGKNGLLRSVIESGRVPNMIFYGPSGIGKTTVANIIARRTERRLYRLNATTAATSDVRAVIEESGSLLGSAGALLYLDEIQYFNKKQQQSLLEFIENGQITLIASTTENPYFYIYKAVLSRCTVFEFKSPTPEEILPVVRRAAKLAEEEYKTGTEFSEEVLAHLAATCGGDVRKAVNGVEFLALSGRKKPTLEDAKCVSQKAAMHHDREGDEHFDCLSALMKSLRGSDADAALHYLARLLEAGDLIGVCRRLLCSASEDIGLAYPQAVPIVKACVDSAMQLGLPEGRLPLAEAAVFLAGCPKSNSVVMAIDAAAADVRSGKAGPIPRELQNVHADGTGFEREQGYLYPHNYPGHYVQAQYLPDTLKGRVYYHPGDNKMEQATAAYWAEIKSKAGKGGGDRGKA